MTGYCAVAAAAAWAGSTLLIAGGAGQVAQYAIQFAKARGAVVIATVSSEEKASLARAAGADHVLDYRREDVAAAVMDLTDKAGVDAVIEVDLAANAVLLPKVLRPRGTAVVYGAGRTDARLSLQAFLTSQLVLRFLFVYELTPEEREEAIGAITDALEDNRLRHNVALTLPLDEVAAAHEAVESGSVSGKVVITLP
jgi:NADPH2:quinone reductase